MKRTIMAVGLVLLSLASLKADDKQARVLMQAAEAKATVQGDLKTAIGLYLSAVKEAGQNRALAAQALLRAGECYQKLGDIEARNVYERLLREFGDQKDIAAEARVRLTAIRPVTSPPKQAAREILRGPGNGLKGDLPSPDGRYLSFTDIETGDVTVRDLRTGVNRHLTDTGGWSSGKYSDGPIISPDGRRVAYDMYIDSQNALELRVAPLATGELNLPQVVVRTKQDDSPYPTAWMPDGNALMVLQRRPDHTYQIGTVAIQGGSFRNIKSLDWRRPNLVSLSPDGRYVAYDVPAGEAGSPRDIFVLATDGTSEAVAVQNPGNDSFPLWSPDGTQLVFLSDRTGRNSLWRVPIEEGRAKGSPVIIRSDVGSITLRGITNDGTLYYFEPTETRPNLYVADLDAANTATAAAPATERLSTRNVGPSWSHSGEYLAYYSFQDTAADTSTGTLVIRTVKTGEERTLALPARVTSRFGAGPKWFPDSRFVLVELADPQGPGFGFYRMAVENGNIEPLAHLPRVITSYEVSPDGRSLFYSVADDNQSRLIRLDLESHRETELRAVDFPETGWEVVSLAVSPDGSQLATILIGGVVEVMPATGGRPRQLFRPASQVVSTGSIRQALCWTPDQRFLLFGVDGVLWKVPSLGGDAERVGISMTGMSSPAVHPDGKRFVFSSPGDLNTNKIMALDNFLRAQTAGK